MKKGSMVAIIIVVLVFAGAAFALTRKSSPETSNANGESSTSTPSETDSSATTDTNPTTSTDTTPAAGVASETTITYSNSGFGPATVTVKSGGTVTLKNTSSSSVEFRSDPHPTHTDNAELNLGSVAAGSSKTFKVTKTGTWGYHNHLNQTETGNIVVE